ncbi:unnamed protein product [Adineta steineri]|uniref:tRNA-guanine(15) transglycosylase-like domain-containing protein n=1 Tax=Adineta steineri TaxID=433720 RepID=A0A819RLS2_9BILA|nr:unnamed protein product [Adineta steineri]
MIRTKVNPKIIKRNCPGYAVGGEDKDHSWRMVTLSIKYSMGVGYTRPYLNTIVTEEITACHLLTIHSIAYQMRLIFRIRQAINK